MRIPRLFLDLPLEPGAQIELDERAHRYAVQVLRLRIGDRLVIFNGRPEADGDYGEYPAVLQTADRRRSAALLEDFIPIDRESPLAVTLVQGIAKGDHMDYSIQKAVELGVFEIQPVLCERTVGRFDAKRLGNRMAHWQGVAVSACEQSGRTRIPRVAEAVPLPSWLREARCNGLVLDPECECGFNELTDITGPMALLVGPEGGLSTREIQAARDAGLTPVRMGPRVLRTETAAAAALTAVQLRWGDLGR